MKLKLKNRTWDATGSAKVVGENFLLFLFLLSRIVTQLFWVFLFINRQGYISFHRCRETTIHDIRKYFSKRLTIY